MATVYLNNGATSFASANWSDGSGFSTADNDMVIANGSQTITTAVDQNAVRIHSMIVQPQFTGTIGSAGAPMRFTASDGTAGEKNSNNTEGFVRLYHNAGAVFFYPGTAGTAAFDNLAVATGGQVTHTQGTVTRLKHVRGTYNLGVASVITNGEFYGGSLIDATAGTATFTTWSIYDGSHTIRRAGTTLSVYGGTVTLNATAGTITTLNVYGGKVVLRGMPTITTLNGVGGEVDMTSLEIASTITTYNSYAKHKRKGRFNNAILLTVTTDNYYEGAQPDAA